MDLFSQKLTAVIIVLLFVVPSGLSQNMKELEAKLDSLLTLNMTLAAEWAEFTKNEGGQTNRSDATVGQAALGHSFNDSLSNLNSQLEKVRTEKLALEKSLRDAEHLLNEIDRNEIEEIGSLVEFHYQAMNFSCEMLMLGKSLRSYQRLFEAWNTSLDNVQNAADIQTVQEQLDALLKGMNTFDSARKRFKERNPYDGIPDENLIAELQELPPSLRQAGRLVIRMLRDAPKYLDHACKKLKTLEGMGLERLFLEHIRILQFVDSDLAISTAPPREEDFVMTEERLKIYKWLETQVNLVALAKTVELSELCPTE